MPSLHLTVAVSTWNRCALLAESLEQMTHLVVPPDVTWELLVVNNLCTDATDEVVSSFRGRLPVRRLLELSPGLSHARNRALTEARGEFILWTDDDVFVDRNWLAAYAAAFRRWPDSSVFGGPIEPWFEGDPPAWIPRVLDQIGPVYGRQTMGDAPVELTLDRVDSGPYGGNMAMRREALLRFPFDPALGVRHGEYSVGEETEVIRRMLAAGHTGWWTPEPRVRHWVPSSSQSVGFVRRWMIGSGHYIAQSPEKGGNLPRNRPYRLLARIVRHELGFRLRRPFAPPEVWIMNLARASRARGQLQAAWFPKENRTP
ncbi:MAG TPA: glycosyltransferase [Longimicrobiales bacterium]|nr:glycosyltransferase [Longimicrobiales bacterium]